MSWTLVTGGTGFLGRHLVAALRGGGYDVRVLSRRPGSADARAVEALGAHVVPGDLLDRASVRVAVAGVSSVFHLAGRLLEPGVPDGAYERLHVEGTRNLVLACLGQPQLRAVVHCSTTGVLGATGVVPAGEDAPSRPGNVYERTKAEAEAMALDYSRHGALPLCVARPALVYGPGDLHLLRWFRSIQAGLYHVVGRGDNLLHPVYVTDVAEALLRCAERPQAHGRVYHVVGEQPVTMGALAAAIAGALHRPLARTHLPLAIAYAAAAVMERLPGIEPARLPLTRRRVAFMTESRAYSGARAAAELGFVPRVGLGWGLARTVDWYRGAGLL